jgi:putative exosortase-associated protein (TIGR04073 family)
MKKSCLVAVLLCGIMAANSARAQEAASAPNTNFTAKNSASGDASAPATEEPRVSRYEPLNCTKAVNKGGRGLANVVSCPFEIPKQMIAHANRSDTVAGQVGGHLIGVPVGVCWAVYRLGVGVWDFVTCPFPTPKYDKTYIEPALLAFPNPDKSDK